MKLLFDFLDRFDEKSQRKERIQNDRFALASSLWTPFIENCKKAFVTGENLTIDEQLFTYKCVDHLLNTVDCFDAR